MNLSAFINLLFKPLSQFCLELCCSFFFQTFNLILEFNICLKVFHLKCFWTGLFFQVSLMSQKGLFHRPHIMSTVSYSLDSSLLESHDLWEGCDQHLRVLKVIWWDTLLKCSLHSFFISLVFDCLLCCHSSRPLLVFCFTK